MRFGVLLACSFAVVGGVSQPSSLTPDGGQTQEFFLSGFKYDNWHATNQVTGRAVMASAFYTGCDVSQWSASNRQALNGTIMFDDLGIQYVCCFANGATHDFFIGLAQAGCKGFVSSGFQWDPDMFSRFPCQDAANGAAVGFEKGDQLYALGFVGGLVWADQGPYFTLLGNIVPYNTTIVLQDDPGSHPKSDVLESAGAHAVFKLDGIWNVVNFFFALYTLVKARKKVVSYSGLALFIEGYSSVFRAIRSFWYQPINYNGFSSLITTNIFMFFDIPFQLFSTAMSAIIWTLILTTTKSKRVLVQVVGVLSGLISFSLCMAYTIMYVWGIGGATNDANFFANVGGPPPIINAIAAGYFILTCVYATVALLSKKSATIEKAMRTILPWIVAQIAGLMVSVAAQMITWKEGGLFKQSMVSNGFQWFGSAVAPTWTSMTTLGLCHHSLASSS